MGTKLNIDDMLFFFPFFFQNKKKERKYLIRKDQKKKKENGRKKERKKKRALRIVDSGIGPSFKVKLPRARWGSQAKPSQSKVTTRMRLEAFCLVPIFWREFCSGAGSLQTDTSGLIRPGLWAGFGKNGVVPAGLG